jgi:quinolinate synthase
MATLNQLLERVNQLVEVYGGDTAVASYIMTEADVVAFDDNGDEVEVGSEVAKRVLDEMEDDEFIHSILNDKVDELVISESE